MQQSPSKFRPGVRETFYVQAYDPANDRTETFYHLGGSEAAAIANDATTQGWLVDIGAEGE